MLFRSRTRNTPAVFSARWDSGLLAKRPRLKLPRPRREITSWRRQPIRRREITREARWEQLARPWLQRRKGTKRSQRNDTIRGFRWIWRLLVENALVLQKDTCTTYCGYQVAKTDSCTIYCGCHVALYSRPAVIYKANTQNNSKSGTILFFHVRDRLLIL